MQCIIRTKAFNAFEMSLQVNYVKSILISTPLSQTKKQFRLRQHSFEFDLQIIKMAIQIYRIYLRIYEFVYEK